MNSKPSRRLILVVAGLSLTASIIAQQSARTITAGDYARAEQMLAQNLNGLVVGGNVNATWLPDERFWYRDAAGQAIIVDPVRKTKQACAPSECSGTPAN